MPIFAALRPYLDDAFELAEPGEVYVVGGAQGAGYRASSQGPNGWVNANLRTTFEKLIRRASANPWPRLFHTLRASCETDLLEQFPINAVTEWMGHSATIALKHYSRVPEHLFDRATGLDNSKIKNRVPESGSVGGQKAGQSEANTTVHKTTEAAKTPQIEGFRRFVSDPVSFSPDSQMTLRGFEPRSQP